MSQELLNIDPDELMKANRDYMQRIEDEGMCLVYDSTLDTLFLEIGGPKEALSEAVIDNLMLRIEPDTLRIIGVEILDFFSDFLPNNRLFREAITSLGLEQGKDAELTLMEPKFDAVRKMIGDAIPSLMQTVGTRG